MKMITAFDPTGVTSNTFDPGVVNPCGMLVLFNESPVGLQLTFANGDTASLPPYYFRPYYVVKPGIVQWKSAYNILTGASTTNLVFGESYESTEAKNRNFTEGPLNRQVNIGNSVPVTGSATSVINDNNAANTTIVEAKEVSSLGSNLFMDNAGNVYFAEYVNPNFVKLFQVVAGADPCVLLGANNRTVQVLGNFLTQGVIYAPTGTGLSLGVNNVASNVFTADTTGANTAIKGSSQVQNVVNGVTISHLASDGLHLDTGTISLLAGTLSRLVKQQAKSFAAGATTYTHGLGFQPDFCIPVSTDGSAVNWGWQFPSSTTIVIINGSGSTHICDLLFIKG